MSDDGTTETTIRIKGWIFLLTPTYQGIVHGFPGEKAQKDRPLLPHPHFTVSIRAGPSPLIQGGDKPHGPEVFDYYASAHAYEQGMTHLNRAQLGEVLRCVIGEAIDGGNTFDDFQSEFGYTDCREAFRVYSGCQDQRKKVMRLGLSEDQMVTTLNTLIDWENKGRPV